MQPHENQQEPGIFLNNDELSELTGRKRKDCQLKILRYMGIEHRVRPDGTLAVLREHVITVMGGNPGSPIFRRPEPQPDWNGING